jgi:hypothetical protein
VKLIDLGVLLEREDEAFAVFDIDRGGTFNCQFRHRVIIVNSTTPQLPIPN